MKKLKLSIDELEDTFDALDFEISNSITGGYTDWAALASNLSSLSLQTDADFDIFAGYNVGSGGYGGYGGYTPVSTTPWGNFGGYGGYYSPIQLDEVVITPGDDNAFTNGMNMAGGVAEILGGFGLIIASEGLAAGAGAFMISDGFMRLGLNLGDLLSDQNLPNNAGEAIGSAFGGSKGAKYGGMINDGLSALISGGALTSGWASYSAFRASNLYQAGYEGVSTFSSIYSAYNYWQTSQ